MLREKTFLVGMVLSVNEKMKKTKTPVGHLAEPTNAGPDAMILVDRQKKSIELNVVKETSLTMHVG